MTSAPATSIECASSVARMARCTPVTLPCSPASRAATRASVSAKELSDCASMYAACSWRGADSTRASSTACSGLACSPGVTVARVPSWFRSRSRNSSAAASPAFSGRSPRDPGSFPSEVGTLCEYMARGETAVISPAATSSWAHPGFSAGPENSDVSRLTVISPRTPRSVSALAVRSARSSSPARPLTASGSPLPGANSVSPPATSVRRCGSSPVSTAVARREYGSRCSATVSAVNVFWLDAGMRASPDARSART